MSNTWLPPNEEKCRSYCACAVESLSGMSFLRMCQLGIMEKCRHHGEVSDIIDFLYTGIKYFHDAIVYKIFLWKKLEEKAERDCFKWCWLLNFSFTLRMMLDFAWKMIFYFCCRQGILLCLRFASFRCCQYFYVSSVVSFRGHFYILRNLVSFDLSLSSRIFCSYFYNCHRFKEFCFV